MCFVGRLGSGQEIRDYPKRLLRPPQKSQMHSAKVQDSNRRCLRTLVTG